jgi:hypothetical protein
MNEEREPARTVGRRRLLRRAGGVAAGVGAAAVVGATVTPSPASAAAGGSLVLGQSNDAGTAATGLTAAKGTSGTLALANTAAPATDKDDFDLVGPQLRLVPPAASANLQKTAYDEVGSVGVTNDGTMWLVAEEGYADWVYTTFTANQLTPITPTRILDTRTAAGRAFIINASGNLDSTGHLLGGHSIQVDLGALVYFGTAVHANLTVIFPQGTGFATLMPGAQPIVGQPTTSNLNFTPNVVTQNFALTAIDVVGDNTDVVKIYSSHLTHVVLDVFAFTVNSPGQVNPEVLPGASAATAKALKVTKSRAEMARAGKPTWSK